MKIFFLLPGMSLLFFSFRSSIFINHNYLANDTTLSHLVDGKINEWPVQKFEIDAATEIKYAVDNDSQNLYLAMTIPTFRTQMKIMRQGMELYFDLKGKKKEGKGIDFPVKRDGAGDNSMLSFREHSNEENNGQENAEQKKTNMKAMRAAMALNLISMKVFGFSDDPQEQRLDRPGSANIAYAWDSTDVMNIEYRIPFSLFGNTSPLNQKNISIGWKLNGVKFSSNNSGPTESSNGGRRGGGFSGGGRRNFGGGSESQDSRSFRENFENMRKDQSFWTKYTMR